MRGRAGKSKWEQNRRVLHQSRAKGGNDLSWEGKPESRNGTCGLIIKAGGEGDGAKNRLILCEDMKGGVLYCVYI